MDKQSESHETKRDLRYWRSMDELEKVQTGAVIEQEGEFATSPLQEEETDESRREFVKLMGAATAMFSLSACTRRPVEHIVPYVKKPEQLIPGVANWYASTCAECDAGCGTLVKTREGRPIKVEGNPKHPLSKGGLCARGQASVLNLYDADRLKASVISGRKGSMATGDVDAQIATRLKEIKAKGGRLAVLTGSSLGPSTTKLVEEFVKEFGGGSHHVAWEPLSLEETQDAGEASYGTAVIPRLHFDKAEFVLSFGADFLGTWGATVENAKNFSKMRKVSSSKKDMNRLVAFESMMTLTGSNADTRFGIASGNEIKAALAVANELVIGQSKTRFAGDSGVTGVLSKFPAQKIAQEIGIDYDVIKKTAKELYEAKGKSIVVGAGHNLKGDAGVALENVVNFLNSALDNDGATIDGTAAVSREASSFEGLAKLTLDMKAGKIEALIVHGTNPVYALPKALGFADALSKVGTVIAISTAMDETSMLADYVVAADNAYECWGDASPAAGIMTLKQPTIMPLYETVSFEDALIGWSKKVGTGVRAANFHEYLMDAWKPLASGPFQAFWENALREGGHYAMHSGAHARTYNKGALATAERFANAPAGIKLVMSPKVSMFDGRAANNSWLQEMPDPVSKVTWDNVAAISSAFAKKHGIKDGDVVRVKAGEAQIEVPAQIQPGLHEDTVSIAPGYGRTSAGEVGSNVGANVFALATIGSKGLVTGGIGVQVEKTGATRDLATTQKHHSIENRPIIREATIAEYAKNQSAGNEEHEKPISIWPEHQYVGYRWGMAIDLNSCTGCGSCVIGCQSENNIPVVGRKGVLMQREMHWIRIDRYYSGRADNPETVHQPMLCQHCENAPCETVCPVLATMHDNEGVNQQVYNRCVGTRYCANNCPYKVRRFNWFTYTDVAKPKNLAYNPDVTVRTRGIMEKCTFCVQRVREAKDRAKDQNRAVMDGEILTACQQSCPSDAITFGNVNDKKSAVTKAKNDTRAYRVLEDINVRPSISYMTKIRNNEAEAEATHGHGQES